MPVERPRPEASPGPVRVAAADASIVPASSSAPAAPQDDASTAAPMSPELTQQLQTITRDIANLDQKIEQLRAGQEQLAIQMDRDTARAIEEFKAGQEQMTRLMAKPSEPNARPKTTSAPTSVSPARQAAVTSHQPTSTHASAQARSSSTTRSPPAEQ
jgi:hypothetical protein